MLTPSLRIDASDNSSAAAQSIVRSSIASSMCTRFSRARSSFLCIEKSEGSASSDAFKLAQTVERDRGVGLCGSTWRRRFGLGFDEILFRAQTVVSRLHLGGARLEDGLGFVVRDDAARDQAARPDLTHRWVPRDLLVHQRLREGRFVALVVAVAPVADEVDQEIALEPLAICECQARNLDARLGIVGIDVDDRNFEAAREPAGI